METKDKDFQSWILENESNPELDIVLREMLPAQACSQSDYELAAKGFRDFSERTGLGRKSRVKRIFLGVMKVAAVLVPIAFLATYAVRKAGQASVEWTELGAAFAESASLTLDDGTTVRLSSGSKLIYPEQFFGKTRKVFLVGEAFFDVAKDPSRKFIVSTDRMDITVHGTRFNVCSYTGDAEDEVALVEGSVELSFREGEGNVFLKPGEMLKLDKMTGKIDRRKFAVNYYESVLDADGLQYNDDRLSDIASDLMRRFNVSIVIDDEKLASERYYASFINGEGVDEILSTLNTQNHFKVRRSGETIMITTK